ncbi:MAG: hypothetical protein Q7S49_00910 [bacterium]|nr:hypothetical protein [bacterium]
MKKVFIVHGWGESPDEPLHQWLASELRKKGFIVEVPAMPEPDEPKIEIWIPFLNQLVGMGTWTRRVQVIGHIHERTRSAQSA